MGKTADLTVVQKTTIDTLHKEGKTQKVIAKSNKSNGSSLTVILKKEHCQIHMLTNNNFLTHSKNWLYSLKQN